MTASETGHGFNDFVAGFVSGAAGVVAGHPFETTKVQLQYSSVGSPFKGILDAAKTIKYHGMAQGFFRGMSFPLITQGMMNCVAFGVAGKTLAFFRQHGSHEPSYLQIFFAGSLGGAASLVVQVPVELVKTVLQSQIPRDKVKTKATVQYFKGPVHCLRHIIREQGIKGLYRGLVSTGVRDCPGVGLYYLYYHLCYDALNKVLEGRDKHGILPSILGGGLAGCLNWLTIMPFDVIKTHMQADHSGTRYNGVFDCIAKVYRQRGFRSFYTGTLLACVRGFPVGAAEFFCYTHVLRILNWLTVNSMET